MGAEADPTLEQKSRWLAWGMKALAASLSIGRVGHDSPDSRASQQKALASLISKRSDLASLGEHLPDRVSAEVLTVLDEATRLFGRWSPEDSAAVAELALKSRGVAALLDAYANADKQRGANGPEMPLVDLNTNQVRWIGNCFNVTADAALLLSKLVESHPQPIVASKLSAKPSRIKKSLPEPLQSLIRSGAGKGYWLDVD